jgi:hypothetical protein
MFFSVQFPTFHIVIKYSVIFLSEHALNDMA